MARAAHRQQAVGAVGFPAEDGVAAADEDGETVEGKLSYSVIKT